MTVIPNSPSKLRSGIRFALISLLFGFVGLGIAAYRMSVESEAPPPPRAKEVSDVLADTIKKTADKFRGQKESPPPEASPPQWPMTRRLGLAASVCGFIGAVLGCVSWLTGEHRRWTWAALCVGIAALAWSHVVVAVALAAGLAVLIVILSHIMAVIILISSTDGGYLVAPVICIGPVVWIVYATRIGEPKSAA